MIALVNGAQSGAVINTDGWPEPVPVGSTVRFYGGDTATILDTIEGTEGRAVLLLDHAVSVPDNGGIWRAG